MNWQVKGETPGSAFLMRFRKATGPFKRRSVFFESGQVAEAAPNNVEETWVCQ
jgi:hypothetical protein